MLLEKVADRLSVENLEEPGLCMKNWKIQFAIVVLFLPMVSIAQSADPSDAVALERQGKLPEAERSWRLIVEQNPGDAAAFASLGVVLSKQQEYSEAATVYRKAIALNPHLPGIQLNLGLAEFKQGHFDAAITPLSDALTADPDNAQALALLGLSYYGAKRFAEASKYLELATKIDPANTELRQVLAQSCLSAKKYSCAVEEFRQIMQRNPDSPAAHILAGEALDGLGRTPEAIGEFQAAAKIAPLEPDVNFGLGYLHWKLRQYDDAKKEFEAELSVDPNHAQALAYLGDVELKRNDQGKALELLRKAVQTRSDIRIAYLDIGVILAQQKNYADALTALQRAEKLDSAQPDVHLRLGRLYQTLGNTVESHKQFAKLRELHNKSEEDISSKMSGARPSPQQ
jgi:tetratricopeptide (TPR) repeat protein